MKQPIIDENNHFQQRLRILVVDDEPGIVVMLTTKLELAGFEVLSAGNGKQALDVIAENGLPHLAIVDIIMPEMDGLTFCQKVRQFSDLPIVMLTSVEDEDTIVKTIELYAEDYITKPFRPREVVARVKRVLSRYEADGFAFQAVARVDERLAIDFAHQRVLVHGKTFKLTPTESKLLYMLTMQPGNILSVDYLQSKIWSRGAVVSGALRVNIFRLRQKIEIDPANPKYIQTVRREGYRFCN
jgi:DNA-binding response OmpR family regulator